MSWRAGRTWGERDGMPSMISSAGSMKSTRVESTFPGGLWLSMGFLKDESLGAWQVDSSDMKFAFKNDSCPKA